MQERKTTVIGHEEERIQSAVSEEGGCGAYTRTTGLEGIPSQ